MRESRRTMARRNPDSPAPSTTLQFQVEDFGSFGAEPRRTVTIAEASAFASPAQRTDDGPSDGDKSGAAARALQTSEPTLANETVTSPSRRDATSKRLKAKPEPASPSGPDFSIEAARLALNARHVAGVDEAGRGPLAGPVVAAAVILDMAALPVGLDDSKKLTAAIRERLFEEIVRSAVVSVASASAVEIDRWNIRQATLLAMTRALAGLERMPCHAIVDGRDVPVAWTSRGTAVIEGDARSLSIAAASIIAKVTRDRMMQRLCAAYPAYGFSRHMGYATAEHRLALDRHGPCPFHRMTFSPIRQGSLDLG